MLYEKAYLNLISFFLNDNCEIEVSDCEGVLAKRSNNFSNIKNACESVEECTLKIFKSTKEIGVAFCIVGLEKNDSIVDFIGDDDAFINWWNQYSY